MLLRYEILSNDSCIFSAKYYDSRFPILYVQIKEIFQTFQVYPHLSLICQRMLQQKGRKRKSDVEKADYKKHHTTYNKKRNF